MFRVLICWTSLVSWGAGSPDAIAIWRAGSGLPHQNVKAITQTSDGYLWVGTADGLARFDGVHFTVYRSENIPQLGSGKIERLAAGVNGRLWIGTADGVLLKKEGGTFTRVLGPGDPFLSPGIEILTEDRQGTLWITSRANKIARFADGQLRVMTDVWKIGGQLRLDGDGEPVVNGPSLWRLRGDTLVPIDGQPTGVSRYLAPGHRGAWIEQNGQVRRWSEEQGLQSSAAPQWGARDLTFGIEDRRTQLWLATSGHGLLCYGVDASVRSLDTTSGFAGDFVQALFEDRDGNVWVGTAGGGLGRISPAWFQVYGKSRGLSSDRTTAVCQDTSGTVWVGTAGDGINRIGVDGVTKPGEFPGIATRTISALAAGPGGAVWAGFGDGGVQLWQDGKWTPVRGWPDAGAATQALLVDHDGSLWVGQKTRNRMARITGSTVATLDLPNPGPVADVRALAQDRDGSVWIGTDGSGLFRYRNGAFNRYSVHDGLGSDSIWSLLACDDGSLWIGTAGAGISRWKDGRFANCSKEQGLPESVICALRDDGQDGIWITGYQGLFRLDRRGMESSFEKGTRVAPVIFGKADGLPELQGVGSGSPSLFAADGKLWFATTAGAVTFDPKDRVHETMPPPVFIDGLVVDGVSLDTAGPLSIPPDSRRYEFRFSAISTAHPEGLGFAYQLDGVDDGWQTSGQDRAVSYSTLPPGSYVFRLKAHNRDQTWSPEQRLAFTVRAPFWQNPWFFGTATGAGLLSTVWLTRWRMRVKARRKLEGFRVREAVERERSRIARDIHDNLGGSLTEIAMLSDELATGSPEPTGDSLASKARELIQSFDETVWVLNAGNDTLESLLQYLQRTVSTPLRRVGIRYRFEFPEEAVHGTLDAETRYGVLLACKEAIHNIVKHSAAQVVQVRAVPGKSSWTIEIRDDGCGFQMDTVAVGGNGLINLKERLSTLGGSTSIVSSPGEGTCVSIEFPLSADVPKQT